MFQDITDNQTTKGGISSYELLVNWEDDNTTWDPLSVMRRNETIYLANYSRDNYLLDKPGWNQLRRYVNNTKEMNHIFKAAKANQPRNTLNIKFGINIPRGQKEAMMFDAENGNTNWRSTELLEQKKSTNSTPSIILGL